MPIDASIPLQVRPIEVPDPMQMYGRALSLQSMMQQREMNTARLQEMRLQQQLEQQKVKDSQIAQQTFVETNGDMAKFEPLYLQRGGSVPGLQAIQLHHQDVLKKTADLDQQTLDNNAKRNDQLQGAWKAIDDAPDDQKPALYLATKNQLEANGTVRVGQLSPELPTGIQWNLMGAGLKSQSQIFKEATEKRAAAKETREAALAPAQLEEAQGKATATTRQNLLGPLAAATTREQYGSLLKKVPYGMVTDLNLPAQADWDAKTTPSFLRQAGETPAQASVRAERERHDLVMENKATKPSVLETTAGTYGLSWPNGPDKEPSVIEIKTPTGQPIKKQPIGGDKSFAINQANRRELDKGETEEAAYIRDIATSQMALSGSKAPDSKGEPSILWTDQTRAFEEQKIASAQNALAKIYARRVQIGASRPEDVGFPTTLDQANTMASQAMDTRQKAAAILTKKDGETYTNPFEKDPKKAARTMDAEYRAWWTQTYRAANQTLAFARAGKRNLDAGANPPSTGAAETPAQQTAGGSKKWTLGGVTYTEGQRITGPDGKPYRIKSVTNGKIDADPI